MTNKTDLIAKLRMAQVSSCSCLTKTMEVSWHDQDCLYRVLAEAIEFIAAPVVERQPRAWLYLNTNTGNELSFQRLDHYFRPYTNTGDHEYVKGVALYTDPPELAELQAVTLPSVQDDGAEGRGYNKALRDCAAALEAAGVPFANDPRTGK